MYGRQGAVSGGLFWGSLFERGDSMSQDEKKIEPVLINVNELAQMLSVSVRSLWRIHGAGGVPLSVRLGGRIVRWDKGEIFRWIEAGCPSWMKWQVLRGGKKSGSIT